MIPNVAHFIWFGNDMPWVHRVAVRSAARVGQFARVVLHCEPSLHPRVLAELRTLREFDARPIDVRSTFRGVGVDPEALLALYSRLADPAARANVLRAAILAADGGIYLDADTVTVGSFAALRQAEVFCGAERVAVPATLRHGGAVRDVARAYGLTMLRDVMRRLPEGYRSFRRFESMYALAPNNAVIGARPN
ncbi:MAG TPA: glycosyltransferase, partial [Polyangiales bacterium]